VEVKKITQTDVGLAVGLSRTTINKILNGDPSYKTNNATRQMVHKAAKRLGYIPVARTKHKVVYINRVVFDEIPRDMDLFIALAEKHQVKVKAMVRLHRAFAQKLQRAWEMTLENVHTKNIPIPRSGRAAALEDILGSLLMYEAHRRIISKREWEQKR